MKMFLAIVPFLIMVAACDRLIPEVGARANRQQGQHKIELGDPFDLAVGNEVLMEGEQLFVRFDSLIGDSRCPINAFCIWEGDGTVSISIKKNKNMTAGELHTHDGGKSRLGDYEISLKDLRSFPRADEKNDRSLYSVTLIVTKP